MPENVYPVPFEVGVGYIHTLKTIDFEKKLVGQNTNIWVFTPLPFPVQLYSHATIYDTKQLVFRGKYINYK